MFGLIYSQWFRMWIVKRFSKLLSLVLLSIVDCWKPMGARDCCPQLVFIMSTRRQNLIAWNKSILWEQIAVDYKGT